MRSSTPPDLKGRCRACFLPAAACICRHLPRVETRAHFLILRHVKETWKSTNTGRLAALALPGATLKEYGRDPDAARAPVDLSRTWVLFPDSRPNVPPGQPDRVVVLDATWPQARRMTQRMTWLRGLPRLSLHPSGPAQGLRREPAGFAMSTLLAIARAVALLEGPTGAHALEALHAEFVARVRSLKGGPAVLRASSGRT